MSRIAKKPIQIPQGTQVNIASGKVTVKGPQGELSREFKDGVLMSVEGSEINVTANDTLENKALLGTYAAHLKNMIAGVNKQFSKELLLEGVGFKSEVSGNNLVLALGFSHPVKIEIPKTLKVTAEKNVITITGANKEDVGQFSAFVRDHKKPEPYKGKGFRYRSEVIRRKEGKKTA